MKCVLIYHGNPAGLPLARELFPLHKEKLIEFSADGRLLMVGPFADPAQGAMSIFRDRASAEAFVAGDPFVLKGAVLKWDLLDWNEVSG